MLRSLHFYGYGLLIVAILAIAAGWWSDHVRLWHRVAALNASAEKLTADLKRSQADHAQGVAILDHNVDYLVAELQKNGVRIERMAGGGFRHIYGNVPTNPTEFPGQPTIINSPEDVARLPKDRQPLYTPR
jgi:hypothetical protein